MVVCNGMVKPTPTIRNGSPTAHWVLAAVGPLRQSWGDLRDWLVPPTCALCGQLLGQPIQPLLCGRCLQALQEPIRHPCSRCGMPIPFGSLPGTTCYRCRARPPRYRGAVAWGAYRGTLREAVVRSKQAAWEPLTGALGALLSEKLAPFAESWNLDTVIPIPSHWRRRLRRGTNGAEILAETVARELNLPLDRASLRSARLPHKQGTLSPSERRSNVRHAFKVRPAAIRVVDRTILLIDDVMTTGATLEEATKTLIRGGARAVYVAVVARGIGSQQVAQPVCHDDSTPKME